MMQKVIEILSKITNPVAKIIVIVCLLVILGISLFFTGCAYKVHVDKIDNLTREFNFKGD